MAIIRLTYVHEFVDRHGKIRRYFRRNGKRVPLPGLPGSREFLDAYQTALAGASMPESNIGAERTKAGSVSALVAAFYASSSFKQLAPVTQKTYRNRLERFRIRHGDKRWVQVQTQHIRRLVDEVADRPGVANELLKTIRTIARFAVERGLRVDDPTHGLKTLRSKTEGFLTWSEENISRFEARFPLGTRQRLALALLLYTGQRRGDVVRLGRKHVRDGVLSIIQTKTGTAVDIPVHPELTAAIAAGPAGLSHFLLTDFGRPFTANGFGNWFREAVEAAGLPQGLTAHGLRKAACRRLAEAGCSSHEIMSISGHRSLQEVERYTRAANREQMAQTAMKAMVVKFGRKG